MKLGLNLAATSWDGGAPRLAEKLAEIAECAEAVGFDLISVPDHVWQTR